MVSDDFDHWCIDPSDLRISSERLLGKGAAGEVWAGTWRSTPVAVKRFKKSTYAIHEYNVLRFMHHPNIVQMLGISILPDGQHVLVFEYLKGRTLYTVLGDPHFRTGYRWASNVTQQILMAMRYMHEHRPEGVAHRDIKPSNILLVDDTVRVKIIDFGLAVMGDQHGGSLQYTHVGTPVYMAPELHEGQPPLCSLHAMQKTDIYSMALVLRMIWERVSYPDIEWIHTPRSIRCVLFNCLHNDPTQRPLPSQILEWMTHTRSFQRWKETICYDYRIFWKSCVSIR